MGAGGSVASAESTSRIARTIVVSAERKRLKKLEVVEHVQSPMFSPKRGLAKADWPKRGAVGVGGFAQRRVPSCAVCVGVKGIAGHPIGSSARAVYGRSRTEPTITGTGVEQEGERRLVS